MKKFMAFAILAAVVVAGTRYSRRNASLILSSIEKQSLHDAPNDGQQSAGGVWSRLKEKFGLGDNNTAPANPQSAAADAPQKLPNPEKIAKIAGLTAAILKNGGFMSCNTGEEARIDDQNPYHGSCLHDELTPSGTGTRYSDVTIFSQADFNDDFVVQSVGGQKYLLFKPLIPANLTTLADLSAAIVTPENVAAGATQALKITQERSEQRHEKQVQSDLSRIEKTVQGSPNSN